MTGDILNSDRRLVRDGRRVTRLINNFKTADRVRQAQIEAEEDATHSKIEALTMVTGSAMSAIARVGQAQLAYQQIVPVVAQRLNFVAEMHTIALQDVLHDLRRDLRRM